jgi:hypothetical protein
MNEKKKPGPEAIVREIKRNTRLKEGVCTVLAIIHVL